jgi:hypothetical protein
MRCDLPISNLEILRRYQRNVTGKEYIIYIRLYVYLNRDYPVENISDCLGIDIFTVYHYWNFYQANGLDSF